MSAAGVAIERTVRRATRQVLTSDQDKLLCAAHYHYIDGASMFRQLLDPSQKFLFDAVFAGGHGAMCNPTCALFCFFLYVSDVRGTTLYPTVPGTKSVAAVPF